MAVGVIIASILHTIFNYLIIIKDAIPVVLTLLILLITLMAVAVFVEFERLKKKSQIGTNNYTD